MRVSLPIYTDQGKQIAGLSLPSFNVGTDDYGGIVCMFSGFCGRVQWIKDLLSACVLYVSCRCTTVCTYVPIPGEETVQVSSLI